MNRGDYITWYRSYYYSPTVNLLKKPTMSSEMYKPPFDVSEIDIWTVGSQDPTVQINPSESPNRILYELGLGARVDSKDLVRRNNVPKSRRATSPKPLRLPLCRCFTTPPCRCRRPSTSSLRYSSSLLSSPPRPDLLSPLLSRISSPRIIFLSPMLTWT